MANVNLESELRIQEQALINKLAEKNTHGINTVREAIALGTRMGTNEIEIAFLKEDPVVQAIKSKVRQVPYITVVKSDLRQLLVNRLAGFKSNPRAEVSSQTIKEVALASATLGHLRNRRHLIP